MINVLALRSQISTLLQSQLGTYTFSNSLTTPAIRVEPSKYEEDPDVSGLEVVINVENEVEVFPMLGGDVGVNTRSQIILKQWDDTASTSAARDALIRELDIVSIVTVPRLQPLGNIETCTITIEADYRYLETAATAVDPVVSGLSIPLIVAATGL